MFVCYCPLFKGLIPKVAKCQFRVNLTFQCSKVAGQNDSPLEEQGILNPETVPENEISGGVVSVRHVL